MKKPKLHLFAKLAAITVVGGMPLLGAAAANAQDQMMPPIISGKAAASADTGYSYAGKDSAPLAPAMVSGRSSIVPPVMSGMPLKGISSLQKPVGTSLRQSKAMPPIVSGKAPSTTSRPQSTQPRTTSSMQNLLAPIGSGVQQTAGTAEPARIARAFSPSRMPIMTPQTATRTMPAPAVQIEAPPFAMPSTPATSPSMAPVISGTLLTPDSIPAANMGGIPATEAPTWFDSAPVTSPVEMSSVVSGCSDCGGSGCSTCNTGCSGCETGCNSCGGGNNVNCDYGTYGSVSAARRYAYLEYLYLTREDGDITNSNFNPLGEFDFSTGWRFTLGQRPDMTQGREISYFGTEGIDARQVTNNAANRLDALFSPAGGLITGDLSSFYDASRHVQFKETTLHSLELNRVRWGWDVLKSFVGWRYIYMDDQYQLDSTAPVRDAFGVPVPGAFESGRYRIDTVNHMLGAHIGAELFYDIGYRFSLSGMSKYGVYANINKVDNFLQNGGTTILDTEDNGANISSTWEVHLLAHYQIRQTARLRFGYNGLFLGNVATVSDNFSAFVSPFTGFNGTDDDDAFVHGFTVGLEIYR